MRNLKPISKLPLFFRRALLATLCLYLGAATSLWAQLQLVPLGVGVPHQGTETTNTARIQAIQLPFFDDFSTATSTNPDTQLWKPGSGVYINNTLTTRQPSINVATFDGLDAAGVPYNFRNEQAQGDSDTLVSQPIALGGLKPADSLYISYYWQAKGLGELPDRADTLRLEFLTNTGNWVAVWKQAGEILTRCSDKRLSPLSIRPTCTIIFSFGSARTGACRALSTPGISTIFI